MCSPGSDNAGAPLFGCGMTGQIELTIGSTYGGRGGGSLTHEELTLRAIRWLHNRVSFRGIRYATEIHLAKGYVADAVAIGGFQGQFHSRYIDLSGLRPDEQTEWLTIHVFEAKATRADFISTFGDNPGKHGNRHKPIGGLHWVVVPAGIVKPEEVPSFWGLLEARGRGLSEKKAPYFFDVDWLYRAVIAEEILWQGVKYDRLAKIPTCPDCLKDYRPA